MNRSETRKIAFELLYSLEVQKLIKKEEYEEQIRFLLKNKEINLKAVEEYVYDIIFGVKKYESEILELIEPELSPRWELSRVSKINIAILKLAIYEIKYKKLPYKVAVNEAVEIAKVYSDDGAPAFINGILASVIKKSDIKGEATE